MKFGFEGSVQQSHSLESIEKSELCEKACKTFDEHVQNLERFELAFAGQEAEPEYAFLRNELLRRIYESGKLMEEANKS